MMKEGCDPPFGDPISQQSHSSREKTEDGLRPHVQTVYLAIGLPRLRERNAGGVPLLL